MNDSLASGFTQMNASIHTGKFYKDYDRHKPAPGKVKMKEFAQEFAAVYRGQSVSCTMLSATEVYRITSISEFLSLMGLPRPEHPLISVINLKEVRWPAGTIPAKRVLDYYTISLKRSSGGNFKYGQQQYDARRGVMYF